MEKDVFVGERAHGGARLAAARGRSSPFNLILEQLV
jgi:hypothetical protein